MALFFFRGRPFVWLHHKISWRSLTSLIVQRRVVTHRFWSPLYKTILCLLFSRRNKKFSSDHGWLRVLNENKKVGVKNRENIYWNRRKTTMIQQQNDSDDRDHVRGVMKGKDSDCRPIVRKIICRYGRGCTHMNDPSHRERFWHPPLPLLSADQLRTHYICNECGIATTSLPDLQVRRLERYLYLDTSPSCTHHIFLITSSFRCFMF